VFSFSIITFVLEEDWEAGVALARASVSCGVYSVRCGVQGLGVGV
jgi:hypothetical protein